MSTTTLLNNYLLSNFKLLFTMLSAMLTIISSSQNYQAINPDRIYLFEEEHTTPSWSDYHQLRAISIDTVIFSSQDTILYNFNTIGYKDSIYHFGACFTPDGTSWLGTRVIKKPDGDMWFFNSYYENSAWQHRVMNLKTRAALNESWIFYNSGTSVITAEVISVDTMSFFGISDTVKEIELTVSNDYYGTILISKNNGMVKTIIFRDMNPDIESEPETVNLIGITNPSAGYQPITWGDIHNYEVGDIFHKNIHYNTGFDFYESNEVIDKIIHSDTNKISYVFERYHWGYPGPGTYVFEHDTVPKTYYSLSSIVRGVMPYQTDFLGSGNFIGDYIWYSSEQVYNGRKIVKGPMDTYEKWDTCYYLITGVDKEIKILNHALFIVGCGQYDNLVGALSLACYPCNILKYFKKGTEEWGTPLNIPVGAEEKEVVPILLIVFPNPADDYLTIEFSELMENPGVEICDILGKKQESKIIDRSGYAIKVDVSLLQDGVYIASVSMDNLIHRIRFVKHQ